MKIDPQRFPTMHKAYKLEKEAEAVRNTPEYRREAHLYFCPSITVEEVERALKEIDRYKHEHEPCVCDGYCRVNPSHAYHIVERARTYDIQGAALGLPPKYNVSKRRHP